jgi:hypothetical protein
MRASWSGSLVGLSASPTCGARPGARQWPGLLARPGALLADQIERLSEAVYTLAAVHIALRDGLPPDQAAVRVAEMRHEVRHALRDWTPPRGSYRARDLPR